MIPRYFPPALGAALGLTAGLVAFVPTQAAPVIVIPARPAVIPARPAPARVAPAPKKAPPPAVVPPVIAPARPACTDERRARREC